MSAVDRGLNESKRVLFEVELTSLEKKKQYSLGSVTCKICFDAGKAEESITPCLCKGSIGKVHLSCLELWLSASNSHACELCGYQFMTTRRPRHGQFESAIQLLFKEKDALLRGSVRFDLVTICSLAPMVVVVIYLCISTAALFGLKETVKEIATHWANVAMTLLAVAMALIFYLWTTGTLRRNFTTFYRYWQAHNVVHLLNPRPEDPQPSTSTGEPSAATSAQPASTARQTEAVRPLRVPNRRFMFETAFV